MTIFFGRVFPCVRAREFCSGRVRRRTPGVRRTPASAFVLAVVTFVSLSCLANGQDYTTVDQRFEAVDKRLKELEDTVRARDIQIQQLESGRKRVNTYTPHVGFKVADTEKGDLNIKIFTYIRYLNQTGLDSSFTDSFGQTSTIQQRQDIQYNKVNIFLSGWFLDPKFRYMTYVWTSNTSQGLGAQVVVAGNLNYNFNDHLTFGGGTESLPGVRSTEGNFPYWLGVDNRLISDEFFRPSYTFGVWAKGKVVHTLNYAVMLGNNLSQLGVDAGQMDNELNTWSGVLTWMPTTGEFGKRAAFGDFEHHTKPATRVGLHFTRSDESKQSQPADTNSFENVQIKLSDGNTIFKPNLFGAGTSVENATYQMSSVDGGVKYRGLSLEGETYWRWITDFRGPGTGSLSNLTDTGYQIQASAMVQPQTVQVYVSNSKVYGQYGDPWDARLGMNWFPWKSESARWNLEYIQLYKSPVGGLSLPYTTGGTGPIFYTNFMVSF
jgi:hypothetical protein